MIDKTMLIPALIGALLLISISSENASGVDFTLVVVNPLSQSDETQQGSSGGGSGGGGGGGSGENYSNIVVKEKYEQHIFKDKTTSYRFKNASNPIIYINITGNINAGAITTMVEVLRNTSMLVKTQPPGITYVNVNIWVGTSGFAVPKNIKTALIGFKVNDSWIKSNGLSSSDVKLVKWDGSQWIQLETRELEKTDEFTFYEATTNSFSPFAIVAKVPGTIPAETPEVTQQPITTQTPTEVPTESTAIRAGTYLLIAVGIILIVIIAVEVNMFRKRKENK
ncbi:MAG: PGF-pre-PGF domain-containing protein [Candidatus Marinimicrobia bacterium]|nr:PGF-pre-PGF domain-containing protein [Candidatus Neomarinimicrobiota bacterium]